MLVKALKFLFVMLLGGVVFLGLFMNVKALNKHIEKLRFVK